MFCPRCKCEYREGFKICSDCSVQLVEELPTVLREEHTNAKIEYTDYELISTKIGFTEVVQIQSVFDSEGILYYIQGENTARSIAGLQPRILVKKEQFEEAKQLLKAFNLI